MTSPEQSIKIKDLIFIVFQAWRQVLVLALAGVVLLGGLAFYRSRPKEKVEAPKEEILLTDKEITDIKTYLKEKDPEFISQSEDLEKLNNRRNSLVRRLENSIYLTIDEKDQKEISFEVVVEPEQPLPGSEDTYAQRKYFLSLDFLKLAKGDLLINSIEANNTAGYEAPWIRELVDFELGDDNVLYFKTIGPDEETVECIAEAAQQFFLKDIREHLTVTYLFGVQIRNEKIRSTWNPDVKLEKQQLENDLVELHLAIANGNIIIDLLTEQALEEALADKVEKAEEEAAKTPPAPKPSRKKEMIKYGLAGALIGILIAAFIAVFRATSSGRIWSPEEFADQVKLFYIGSVYQLKDKEAGKLGTGLDRLFRRLFYGRREQDPQTDLAYAASVLEGLACEDQASREADSVYTLAVIGSGVDALLDQLIETLNGFDGMEAVKVEPDTAEGVKRLSTADGVVQLVEARETRVKKAVHELELSLSLGRRILGIVGLEIV